MALIVKGNRSEEVPKDAIKITEGQAVQYQMNIIRDWENFWEVSALKSGPGFMGGLTVISSFMINNHFRYKLKLGQYGRMSSYLAVIAMPACLSTVFHITFIQPPILIRNYECPICIQTRSAAIQAVTGVVYPFLLAPVAAFMFATRHFTYRLPPITSQPKEVLKLFWKFTRSGSTMASVLLGVNLLSAMYITSKEISQHANINKILEDYDKNIENGGFLPENKH